MFRSLRWRFSLVHALASLVVGLILLAGVIIYVVHGTHHRAKIHLKYIGHNFRYFVPTAPERPLSDAQKLTISRNLSWADPEGRVFVDVRDLDGRLLYQSGYSDEGLHPPAWRQPTDDYFIFRAEMSGLEDWDYTMWYQRDNIRITMQEFGEYETLEDLLIGGAIFVFVLLLLSLIMGYRLGKNLARPIERIGATARDIRAGDLGARIHLPPAHHQEIQQLADNLDRTFTQLQTLYNQASEFSGNAAHELRTPLTALRGKIEVALRADRSAEDYQATLCDCMDDIAALQKIIDALLLLSRPPDHWGPHAFTTVDLAAVCRHVVDPYQAMADEKGITLRVDLQPDLPITGMEQFLHQLLSNLLQNAVKFSPPGTQITLTARRADDSIRLRIADQGIGMTPDVRARIFDRFYQADSSRNIGTGLGLALVKYIADLHDTPILVESQPDHGTTFTLDFPASRADG